MAKKLDKPEAPDSPAPDVIDAIGTDDFPAAVAAARQTIADILDQTPPAPAVLPAPAPAPPAPLKIRLPPEAGIVRMGKYRADQTYEVDAQTAAKLMGRGFLKVED